MKKKLMKNWWKRSYDIEIYNAFYLEHLFPYYNITYPLQRIPYIKSCIIQSLLPIWPFLIQINYFNWQFPSHFFPLFPKKDYSPFYVIIPCYFQIIQYANIFYSISHQNNLPKKLNMRINTETIAQIEIILYNIQLLNIKPCLLNIGGFLQFFFDNHWTKTIVLNNNHIVSFQILLSSNCTNSKLLYQKLMQ